MKRKVRKIRKSEVRVNQETARSGTEGRESMGNGREKVCGVSGD